MSFTMQMTGLAQMKARIAERKARAADLTVPLEQSGAAGVTAAKLMFRSNDWAPNTANTVAAKGSSQPGIDDGRGWQSITAADPTPSSIRWGTNLQYMRWFQEGTGTYAGHGSWEIRAQKGSLRWVGAGGVAFARRVIMQGQPSRVFLKFDDELVAKIRGIFTRYLMLDDTGGTSGLT